MNVGGIPVPEDWIVQGGAAGLLGLAVLLVLTGRLVPRRTIRSIEDERDLWRNVALKAMGHTEALLPAAQIAADVTRQLGVQTTPPGPQALPGRDELG